MALTYIVETKALGSNVWTQTKGWDYSNGAKLVPESFATRELAEKRAEWFGADGASVRIVPVDEPSDEERAEERAEKMADLHSDVFA